MTEDVGLSVRSSEKEKRDFLSNERRDIYRLIQGIQASQEKLRAMGIVIVIRISVHNVP